MATTLPITPAQDGAGGGYGYGYGVTIVVPDTRVTLEDTGGGVIQEEGDEVEEPREELLGWELALIVLGAVLMAVAMVAILAMVLRKKRRANVSQVSRRRRRRRCCCRKCRLYAAALTHWPARSWWCSCWLLGNYVRVGWSAGWSAEWSRQS
jgi:hypothetical protein